MTLKTSPADVSSQHSAQATSITGRHDIQRSTELLPSDLHNMRTTAAGCLYAEHQMQIRDSNAGKVTSAATYA